MHAREGFAVTGSGACEGGRRVHELRCHQPAANAVYITCNEACTLVQGKRLAKAEIMLDGQGQAWLNNTFFLLFSLGFSVLLTGCCIGTLRRLTPNAEMAQEDKLAHLRLSIATQLGVSTTTKRLIAGNFVLVQLPLFVFFCSALGCTSRSRRGRGRPAHAHGQPCDDQLWHPHGALPGD